MSRTLLTPSFWRIIFSGGGENAVKSAGFFSFKTNGDFELMFQRAGEVLVCCILCWIQRQCSWELHLLSSCGMSYHSVSAIEWNVHIRSYWYFCFISFPVSSWISIPCEVSDRWLFLFYLCCFIMFFRVTLKTCVAKKKKKKRNAEYNERVHEVLNIVGKDGKDVTNSNPTEYGACSGGDQVATLCRIHSKVTV